MLNPTIRTVLFIRTRYDDSAIENNLSKFSLEEAFLFLHEGTANQDYYPTATTPTWPAPDRNR
jgi:hypothetical protein